MFKKVFLTLGIMFSLFLFSTFSFGTNGVMNSVNHVGNQVNDSMHKAGSAAGNVVNGAAGAVQSAANSISNGLTNNNAARTTTTHNATRTATNNNNYTAARTAATAKFGGLTVNTWTWLILGATAIIIGALVWYYAARNDTSRRHVDNNR